MFAYLEGNGLMLLIVRHLCVGLGKGYRVGCLHSYQFGGKKAFWCDFREVQASYRCEARYNFVGSFLRSCAPRIVGVLLNGSY